MRRAALLLAVAVAEALSEAAASSSDPAVPPAALSYVSPAALGAMRNFFMSHANTELWKEKNVLALVQGNAPAGASPPQTLAPFVAPLTPPTGGLTSAAAWSDYNLNMVAFWYRFKYGFAIFKSLTKAEDAWLDASIAYFDLLANGYIAANQFLALYGAHEQAKAFVATDVKTYFPAHLAWLSISQAYLTMTWVYNENAKDMLTIQAAVGADVDAKAVAYFDKAAPMMQSWAMATWFVNARLQTVAKWWDGAKWDAAKWNSALSLYYQMKFANTMQSLAMLALTPDEQPMAAYLKPLEPWLGFSLSYLPYGVTIHNALARAAAPATAPTTGTTTTTGTATTVTTAASGDAENVIDGASGTTLIAAAPAEPEHPLTAAAKALEGALDGKKSE